MVGYGRGVGVEYGRGRTGVGYGRSRVWQGLSMVGVK